jgi:frataxin-like iron-binding protein CyaY
MGGSGHPYFISEQKDLRDVTERLDGVGEDWSFDCLISSSILTLKLLVRSGLVVGESTAG